MQAAPVIKVHGRAPCGEQQLHKQFVTLSLLKMEDLLKESD